MKIYEYMIFLNIFLLNISNKAQYHKSTIRGGEFRIGKLGRDSFYGGGEVDLV